MLLTQTWDEENKMAISSRLASGIGSGKSDNRHWRVKIRLGIPLTEEEEEAKRIAAREEHMGQHVSAQVNVQKEQRTPPTKKSTWIDGEDAVADSNITSDISSPLININEDTGEESKTISAYGSRTEIPLSPEEEEALTQQQEFANPSVMSLADPSAWIGKALPEKWSKSWHQGVARLAEMVPVWKPDPTRRAKLFKSKGWVGDLARTKKYLLGEVPDAETRDLVSRSLVASNSELLIKRTGKNFFPEGFSFNTSRMAEFFSTDAFRKISKDMKGKLLIEAMTTDDDDPEAYRFHLAGIEVDGELFNIKDVIRPNDDRWNQAYSSLFRDDMSIEDNVRSLDSDISRRHAPLIAKLAESEVFDYLKKNYNVDPRLAVPRRKDLGMLDRVASGLNQVLGLEPEETPRPSFDDPFKPYSPDPGDFAVIHPHGQLRKAIGRSAFGGRDIGMIEAREAVGIPPAVSWESIKEGPLYERGREAWNLALNMVDEAPSRIWDMGTSAFRAAADPYYESNSVRELKRRAFSEDDKRELLSLANEKKLGERLERSNNMNKEEALDASRVMLDKAAKLIESNNVTDSNEGLWWYNPTIGPFLRSVQFYGPTQRAWSVIKDLAAPPYLSLIELQEAQSSIEPAGFEQRPKGFWGNVSNDEIKGLARIGVSSMVGRGVGKLVRVGKGAVLRQIDRKTKRWSSWKKAFAEKSSRNSRHYNVWKGDLDRATTALTKFQRAVEKHSSSFEDLIRNSGKAVTIGTAIKEGTDPAHLQEMIKQLERGSRDYQLQSFYASVDAIADRHDIQIMQDGTARMKNGGKVSPAVFSEIMASLNSNQLAVTARDALISRRDKEWDKYVKITSLVPRSAAVTKYIQGQTGNMTQARGMLFKVSGAEDIEGAVEPWSVDVSNLVQGESDAGVNLGGNNRKGRLEDAKLLIRGLGGEEGLADVREILVEKFPERVPVFDRVFGKYGAGQLLNKGVVKLSKKHVMGLGNVLGFSQDNAFLNEVASLSDGVNRYERAGGIGMDDLNYNIKKLNSGLRNSPLTDNPKMRSDYFYSEELAKRKQWVDWRINTAVRSDFMEITYRTINNWAEAKGEGFGDQFNPAAAAKWFRENYGILTESIRDIDNFSSAVTGEVAEMHTEGIMSQLARLGRKVPIKPSLAVSPDPTKTTLARGFVQVGNTQKDTERRIKEYGDAFKDFFRKVRENSAGESPKNLLRRGLESKSLGVVIDAAAVHLAIDEQNKREKSRNRDKSNQSLKNSLLLQR